MMKDMLIPLGVLLFIGFFIYAIIHTARKQHKEKASVFRDFAAKNRFRYQEEDDGKAQRFAQDFDGIGQFSTPSLGKVIPKDVVNGRLNGSEIILFRHSIRFSESWAREWFVAGISSTEILAERCSLQFCKRSSDKQTMYLRDPVLKEQSFGSYNMVVRAVDPFSGGKIVNEVVLKQLYDLASNLSFRPEIQVRGKRIVAYPADRNATIDDVETLENLFEFTKNAAII